MRIKALLAALLLVLVPLVGRAQNRARMNSGVLAKSGNYTLTCGDAMKLTTFSATATATLPTASTCPTGYVFPIKNVAGAGVVVTVAPSSGTVDGVSSIPLQSGQGADFFDDGSNYTTQSGRDKTVRSCDVVVGDASGAVITNAQLGPQIKICQLPFAATVVEVDVAADGGTPNVIVAKRHCTASPCVVGANETVSNLVSSALATASSGGTACSKSGATAGVDTFTTCSATLQNTSVAAGDFIELVSGTAGGTAKLMTVHVIYTVN